MRISDLTKNPLSEWFKRVLFDLFLGSQDRYHPTQAEEEKFLLHGKMLAANTIRFTAVIMFILTLIALPSDFLVFEIGSREFWTIVAWRLAVFSSCLSFYIAFYLSAWCRENPNFVGVQCFSISMVASGYLVGSVGGLESPLTYGIYTAPLFTVLLIVPFAQRMLATLWLILLYIAGFALPFPEHLDHPMIGTPVVWLMGVTCITVAVGHVVYFLLRENFFQRLTLDRRVAEQTHEIRELADRLISIQERERRRIGRDIHDESGQILVGLRMELDRIGLVAERPAADPAQIKEGIALCQELLDRLHVSYDHILRALHPPTLRDGSGLAAAAAKLSSNLQNQHRIRCEVQASASMNELNEESATALYRILQESLTNTVKHSAAKNVSIRMNREGNRFLLVIRDDGMGFDPETVGTKERFGLSGIKERARWLGGSCRVVSAPGRGSTIEIAIPYPAGWNEAAS